MRNFYFYMSTLKNIILRHAKFFYTFFYLYFFGSGPAQPKGAGLGPAELIKLQSEAISRVQQLCEGN
jgi:hypothetical protein